MTPEELAGIVANPRLSNEAVRLILFVAAGGLESQEIEADELRIVLDCKTDRKVYGARDRAVREGFLEWSRGGRAHSNLYRYTPRFESAKKAESTDESAKKAESKAPPEVVVVRESVNPPIVPLTDLEASAKSLLDAEKSVLGECVKPLAGYLRRRVKPDSQEGYVGRVLGALKPDCMNPPWKDATGAIIPMARRPAIMADALNELATVDERTDRVHPVGDWRNLLNKLQGLCKLENAPPIASTGMPKPRRFNADTGPPALSVSRPRDEMAKLQAEHPQVYAEALAAFEKTIWWPNVNEDEKLRQMKGDIRERLSRLRQAS